MLQELKDIKNPQRGVLKTRGLWRYFVNLWTLFLYVLIVWDFIQDNRFADVVGPVAAIYTASLAIYSAEKEFERWQDYHDRRHPGEVYVIFWTILVFTILIADILFSKPYKMEPEIVAAYIVVLGILAITKKSKALHHKERRRKY